MNDKSKLAIHFPFLDESKEHLSENFSIDDMMQERLITRAIDRIANGVENEEIKKQEESTDDILSYPLSRIIVSYLDDYRIIRNYCMAESKTSIKKLKSMKEDDKEKYQETLKTVLESTGVSIEISEAKTIIENSYIEEQFENMDDEEIDEVFEEQEYYQRTRNSIEDLNPKKIYEKFIITFQNSKEDLEMNVFKIPFEDYIKVSSESSLNSSRLVYQSFNKGDITMPEDKFFDVYSGYLTSLLMEDLPYSVEENIKEKLKDENVEERIKDKIPEDSFSFEIDQVEESIFPPVIEYLLEAVRNNEPIDHNSRFALASFLINIGMSNDEIVELLEVNDTFGEEPTREQLRHIRKGRSSDNQPYVPPSYSKMESWGIDWNKTKLEEKVGHPLSYYKLKLKELQEEDENEEDD